MNIVTKLDVSVNILDQNFDLPWYLNAALNCLDKSSIIAFNMDGSKPACIAALIPFLNVVPSTTKIDAAPR